VTEPEETFVHLLSGRAAREPNHEIFRFVADDGQVSTLTYAELDARARAGAAKLGRLGRVGDRVVLAYPAGLDFIVGFFSCLYAGQIAVPVPLSDKPREAARLRSIVRSAEPVAVLSSGDLAELEARCTDGDCLGPRVLSLPTRDADAYGRPTRLPSSDETAFLQYTSGSVGEPKGVVVTHGNLVANERMIQESYRHDASSHFVGWLPHFHDMGLIGNILQPLFLGSGATLMSPNGFVRDPLRWLELISRYRGRTSGGPNIAYELCALRAARSKTPLSLDLSSWEVAFVGAEPVRAQTMAAFAQAFAPYGFRPKSLSPCYGLAETTLFVSGVSPGTGVRTFSFAAPKAAAGKSQELVSCGVPARAQTLRIVDPTTYSVCPDGSEGEIWVSGKHVGKGYWGKPEESAATFAAHIAGDDQAYLRTGDLGVLRNGELVVTGRLKDLIILHGQNVYPQDVEETLERAHRALRRGGSAAFSLTTERGEQLAVVAEAVRAHAGRGWGEIIDAIRACLADELDLAAGTVVLIPPQSIHKTSSGKIQRRSVRQALLEGKLEVLAHSGLPAAARRPAEAVVES
jgi:acyl-CoA synthetase (AMP-forming)/AMP-acid ligase II